MIIYYYFSNDLIVSLRLYEIDFLFDPRDYSLNYSIFSYIYSYVIESNSFFLLFNFWVSNNLFLSILTS